MALGDADKSWLIFVLTGTIVVGDAGLKAMYDRWSKTASELKTAKETLKYKDEIIENRNEIIKNKDEIIENQKRFMGGNAPS